MCAPAAGPASNTCRISNASLDALHEADDHLDVGLSGDPCSTRAAESYPARR